MALRLGVNIEERNRMCVVCHINASDMEFPLCVDDIIVSVNNIKMAKVDRGFLQYLQM